MNAGTHVSVVVSEDSHPRAEHYDTVPMLVLGGDTVINLGFHDDPPAYLRQLITAAGDLLDHYAPVPYTLAEGS